MKDPFKRPHSDEAAPSIKKVRKEHGDVDTFVKKMEEWLEKVPDPCLSQNKEIWTLAKKDVDWSDPKTIAIAERSFTSIDHAEWLQSVMKRIDAIHREIERSDVENAVERASGVPKGVGGEIDDFIVERFEEKMESAKDFVRSVKGYVEREMNITPKQLEALNNIYKRYREI